jgi:uncharacterized surface protein with fasciclin (FAS1) repeats
MKKIFILAFASAIISLGASAQEKTVMVGGAAMYPSKNIVENAVNSKDHTTLVAAVQAAELVDVLRVLARLLCLRQQMQPSKCCLPEQLTIY